MSWGKAAVGLARRGGGPRGKHAKGHQPTCHDHGKKRAER
jgi:hypothetical protein